MNQIFFSKLIRNYTKQSITAEICTEVLNLHQSAIPAHLIYIFYSEVELLLEGLEGNPEQIYDETFQTQSPIFVFNGVLIYSLSFIRVALFTVFDV